MATGSTGGSEQALQPGSGTSGSAVAFTPGLTGSSLISMRHFSLYQRQELAPHTYLLHKGLVLLGRAMAQGLLSTSHQTAPQSLSIPLDGQKEPATLFSFQQAPETCPAGISSLTSSATDIINLPHSTVLQIWKIHFHVLVIPQMNLGLRQVKESLG